MYEEVDNYITNHLVKHNVFVIHKMQVKIERFFMKISCKYNHYFFLKNLCMVTQDKNI